MLNLLPIYNSASSSASVVDVMTVFCVVDCQAIGPLKSWIRKPCVLFRVAMSSTKLASEATYSVYRVIGEYLIVRNLVVYRYKITLLTSIVYKGNRFYINSASLLAAKAISRRTIAARYIINPIYY